MKTTMKDLYETERPYEKCLARGAGALSDAELLAVILRTGSRGETALALAGRILSLPDGGGLTGFGKIPLERFREIRGVGKVKAVQLKCVAELAVRMSKAAAKERLCFDAPATIADYYMEELRREEQEELIVLFLDTRNRLLKEKMMYRGTVNASLASPREIFQEALSVHAVHLVLVHNHPSGDPTPSRADLKLTGKIKSAGKLLEIDLLDHIIIGDNRYSSLRESGFLARQTDT